MLMIMLALSGPKGSARPSSQEQVGKRFSLFG